MFFFRLAPETKCPDNVRDMYRAIKHIITLGDAVGVDVGRVAVGGDSFGGGIVLSALVMMARNNESHAIKLSILGNPMIGDYCFR